MEMLGMRKNKWTKMKQRLEKGEIHPQTFVDAMKNARLYYSTPFGDGRDGKPHLYILSSHKSEDKYFPAFLYKEHCMQFFTSIGRDGCILLEGDLKGLFSSLDANDMFASMGVVIEPNFPDEITLPPGIRITK